jgi:hypothetical protein
MHIRGNFLHSFQISLWKVAKEEPAELEPEMVVGINGISPSIGLRVQVNSSFTEMRLAQLYFSFLSLQSIDRYSWRWVFIERHNYLQCTWWWSNFFVQMRQGFLPRGVGSVKAINESRGYVAVQWDDFTYVKTRLHLTSRLHQQHWTCVCFVTWTKLSTYFNCV